MISIFNLFIIIPIINILLLAINFILAPHKPYKEKKTPFECGYHSFLSQNRTQFTISFFLFGILFLAFDIEIVLIYPVTVSSYFNAGFGIFVVILFVLILALGFVFELGKGALKIDSKQGRMRMHSSLMMVATLLHWEVPQQIVLSFYDFYTKKLNAFNILFKITISAIFGSTVYLIYFILCSTWCLNLISHDNFGRGFSLLLIMFYFYSLYTRSYTFNWCYNLVNLILVLSLLSVFWGVIFVVTKTIFGAISIVFSSLVFGECVFDMDGDIGSPFTGEENISIFSWNAMFGEDTLNMEGNPGDSSSSHGGSGEYSGTEGTGPPGPPGPGGSEAAAAAGASVLLQPSEQSELSTPSRLLQIDPDMLGELKDNEELRENVPAMTEEQDRADPGNHTFQYLADNCSFKEKEDFRPFFDRANPFDAMRNIDTVKDFDIADAKDKCIEYKGMIDKADSIPQEHKDMIKDNLDSNFAQTSDLYKDTVETCARSIVKGMYPLYEGYTNTNGEFVDKDGVVEKSNDTSSDESASDGDGESRNES